MRLSKKYMRKIGVHIVYQTAHKMQIPPSLTDVALPHPLSRYYFLYRHAEKLAVAFIRMCDELNNTAIKIQHRSEKVTNSRWSRNQGVSGWVRDWVLGI